MPKYKRTIVVACGDKQAGHEGALVNPESLFPVVNVEEDGRTALKFIQPELRPAQERLWKWHENDIKEVQKLAGKDNIVYIGMGDETQGNIFKDDLSEVSMHRQSMAAYYNMVPWMSLPNLTHAYFAAGTPVHLFGPGDTEYELVDKLRREYKSKTIKITNHWMLNINGFKLDIAHHGPGPGVRSWTRGNMLELYARSVMMDCIATGDTVPDGMLRAHKHEPVYRRPVHQAGGSIWEMPAWITPPYCFIGAHAIKVIQSPMRMTVGLIALEIIDGKLYDWHYKPFYHSINLRIEETVQ